jgi:hypothetical protein
MRAGLSFSRSSISLLLRQPLSIKKSYAGAIQQFCDGIFFSLKTLSVSSLYLRRKRTFMLQSQKIISFSAFGDHFSLP